MEFCWALPVTSNSGDYKGLMDTLLKQTKAAEHHGFDSVLVASVPNTFDPWIMGTFLGFETSRIRLLVAQNTNHMLPTYTAKALNTLNVLLNNRIDINIVTGSSSIALARDSRPESHEARYRRTGEFTHIMSLLRDGLTSYDGEFFGIANADIYPKESTDQKARLFVGGSSANAINVAAKYADYYLMYACDYSTIKDQFDHVTKTSFQYNRQVKKGVLVDVIARDTTEEAWEAANKLLHETPKAYKMLTKYYTSTADSVGLQRYRNLDSSNNYVIDEFLWAGLSQINPSVSVSIVGSYVEVIQALNRFSEAGAEYILLTSMLNDNEVERIGTHILPHFK
ncbi:monooxygenase [Paenibacillus xylanexedens]|uniref:LLM class flavin-dependent oxidoreductase n=1 Tax=Paenibacillus xylanexedens TaxID=528191 RepID=UPI0009382D49|nr:LLM class flavin-dependent oxidoreductase [Paenibacillus xylanexedens]APO47195.1 monooxygenase [Paenibacillus xylanexedens]